MDAGGQPENETGRALVAARFIEPLERDGMTRSPRTNPAEHEDFLKRLRIRLAYMDGDSLEALRVIVAGMGEGKNRDRWPALVAIVNFAYAVQPPPDRSDERLWSWFHSRAGVASRQAGTLYATREFIKKMGRPPRQPNRDTGWGYEADGIRDQQKMFDRECERIRRARSMDEARPSEVSWLAEVDRVTAEVEAIVEAGIAHRQAQQKEGADQ